MLSPKRNLSAFRTRLLSSPELQAIVGTNIYVSQIWAINQTHFPCITLFQHDANMAIWAPNTFDPCHILLQIHSKKNNEECYDAYELCNALLHNQHRLTSTSDICFHQIREIWSNSGIFDNVTGVWQLSARYIAYASLKQLD